MAFAEEYPGGTELEMSMLFVTATAGPGEALITLTAYEAAGVELGVLERRQLELKGKTTPIEVYVLDAALHESITGKA